MCTWLYRDFTLFIFEARRALWAPRSVGPYGLGRAPSPLMHAPLGHAYGCPVRGTHYRSRFLFLFVVARPLAFGSFPAPIMHPSGAYAPPEGWCIISRDLLYARVRMPEGQFRPKLSRSRPKLAAGSFFSAGSCGPSMPEGHMGTQRAPIFKNPTIIIIAVLAKIVIYVKINS